MKNKKRVAIIGTNGIPAKYGGFETLAEYLTKELSGNFDFTVYCSSIYKKEERLKFYNGSKLKYMPLKANGFQSILYDTFSTIHSFIFSDVIILLGPAAGFILPLNYFFKKILITNHGGINEWERKKFSFFQRKYAFLSHKLAAFSSNKNIADNIPLKEKLSSVFGVDADVIEYGGDHINIRDITPDSLEKFPFLSSSYFLCVARAQIDNNLHLLIEVFKEIPEKNLVIVSNWNASKYGKYLFDKYKKLKNVILLPAVYEKTDLDVIRSNTDLYIHSHSECGTAPSLVEAMNYKIPIICFDVETNRKTTKNKSLYFKDKNELINIIGNLTNDKLKLIKNEMFELAKRYYSWKKISQKYLNLILEFK